MTAADSTPPGTPSTPGTASRLTVERRLELRQANLSPTRPTEPQLSALDASLRKNTAFIKRLRTVTAETVESILGEFEQLKLTKYVEEAAQALAESRMRSVGDTAAVVEVASRLHQRYSDFSAAFKTALARETEVAEPAAAEERSIWLGRQRQLLRLVAELHLVGIVAEPTPVYRLLGRLLYEDDIKGPLSVPVATSFVKGVGAFYLDLHPLDIQKDLFLIPEWRHKFTEALNSYFKLMCRLLVRRHSKLRTLEATGRRHYETRGDLSAGQTTALQSAAEAVEKLRANLQALAEQLMLQLPEMEELEMPKMLEGKIVFADPKLASSVEKASSIIFDSEEERAFYEEILDLKDRIPELFLEGGRSQSTSSSLASPVPASSDVEEAAATAMAAEEEDLSRFADVDPDSVVGKPINETLSAEDYKSAHNIKVFFERLSSMQSRALADQAAIDFCYINSKAMRKRLVDTLIDLPFRRLDLLPFIGRLLATLKPFFPDICQAVVQSLVGQFVFLFHRKEPIMGTRSRICRFIGELTKFRVMSQSTTHAMLKKTILDDLTGYNIDMTAILLEACGRFLFNQPESHRRLLNLFDVINKKKTQGMDISQIVLLENAMYMSNPPESVPLGKPPKPPRLQYILRLLRCDLEPANADFVFKQIRKCPWQDPACQEELMRAFVKVWRVKYSNIGLLASMVGTFKKLYPAFVVDLVDRVMEELRSCVEGNQLRNNQRALALAKYLGELFCYSVVEVDLIFALLHQLISLGHGGVPRVVAPSSMDPPTNHFRIRLICVVLQSCSSLLGEGTAENGGRFGAFLALFAYYIATKTPAPSDIDYLLEDTFEELNRKRPATTLKEAVEHLNCVAAGQFSFLLEDVGAKLGDGERREDGGDGDTGSEAAQHESSLTHPPDDFDKALSGMVAESVKERRLQRRAGAFDAPIPFALLSPSSGAAGRTALRMLVRKKNRPTTRELAADPSQMQFMESARRGREREAEEARILQQLVLESQASSPGVDLRKLVGRGSQRDGKTTFSLFGGK